MGTNSAILRNENNNSEILIHQLRTKLTNNSDILRNEMDKNEV